DYYCQLYDVSSHILF
nr:immunoglobulin light chain junction region [Macaca mulatta]MOX17044.1 immunoglobulin light chain junction region [Macaca mulatta]MOX17520.1 immunoglobulin light chain junction region [Macaca mulatta]MOX20577.1 immunoglobulin light chain junction region [Macaca mulatta]MOX22394.1 immunoglobulin light chain junction region [Macaca mulatta]